MALTNMRTKRWRVGLNGTAFMGMYLIHPDGSCGPEYNLGDSTHGYVTHEDAKALEAEIERLKIALRYWLPDETMIPEGHEVAWNEHVQLIPEHRDCAVEPSPDVSKR